MAIGVYRTKTYIAGDWTGDAEAIQQILRWNDGDKWSLHFLNVHEYTQSRDTSDACSIKRSLKARMDVSKTFVLVVGNETKDLRAGSCSYCDKKVWNFFGGGYKCNSGNTYDTRSFIDYECDIAVKAGIKIVVLYNSTNVDKNKCPSAIRSHGTHIEMKSRNANGIVVYDYNKVRNAIEG